MINKPNIIKIKDKELKLLLLDRFFEQRFWDMALQNTTKQQITNIKFLMLTFLPLFLISLAQLLIELFLIGKISIYLKIPLIIIPPLILIIYIGWIFRQYKKDIKKIEEIYTIGHHYEYYSNLLKNLEKDWFLKVENKKPDYYERMLKRPPYILALYPKNHKPTKLETRFDL